MSPASPGSSRCGSRPASLHFSARWSARSSPPPSRAPAGCMSSSSETLSPACGFLWGWAMFWSAHSGIIAAVQRGPRPLCRRLHPAGRYRNPRRRHRRPSSRFRSSTTWACGREPAADRRHRLEGRWPSSFCWVMVFFAGRPAPQPPVYGPGRAPFREFVLAISAALFAFGGWHMVTYTAGETRDPRRTIPRALLIGTLTVTACLCPAQRRLSLPAAHRPRDRLHARRGRRRAGRRRTRAARRSSPPS